MYSKNRFKRIYWNDNSRNMDTRNMDASIRGNFSILGNVIWIAS